MKFQYIRMLSFGLSFIFVFYVFASVVYKQNAALPVMNNGRQSKQYTIVIDPGHGGEDGGATSDGGILEKTLNLQISLKISAILKTLGIRHVLTRDTDVMLNNGNTSHKKMHDLQSRVNTARRYESCIFVSIHQNKFFQKKYSGLQVYYSKNDPLSATIAEGIQSSVKTYLQPNNERQTKMATSAIYVLDRLHCPAVLVECGFLSNDEEAGRLASEEYQKKLAFVLSAAIITNVYKE